MGVRGRTRRRLAVARYSVLMWHGGVEGVVCVLAKILNFGCWGWWWCGEVEGHESRPLPPLSSLCDLSTQGDVSCCTLHSSLSHSGKSVGISLLLAGSSESSPCGVKLFHWNFSSITISQANSTSSSSSSLPLGSFFLTQLSHFTITLLLPRGKPSRPVTLDLCSQIMASGLQPNFRTTAATS